MSDYPLFGTHIREAIAMFRGNSDSQPTITPAVFPNDSTGGQSSQGAPSGAGATAPSTHNCEKSARPGFLTSGYRQDGERWTCPDCGKVWEHFCDEAEGCCWFPAPKPRTRKKAAAT